MQHFIKKAQTVTCRIKQAIAIGSARRDDFYHAGARVTFGNRGLLHRAAKRATPR